MNWESIAGMILSSSLLTGVVMAILTHRFSYKRWKQEFKTELGQEAMQVKMNVYGEILDRWARSMIHGVEITGTERDTLEEYFLEAWRLQKDTLATISPVNAYLGPKTRRTSAELVSLIENRFAPLWKEYYERQGGGNAEEEITNLVRKLYGTLGELTENLVEEIELGDPEVQKRWVTLLSKQWPVSEAQIVFGNRDHESQ